MIEMLARRHTPVFSGISCRDNRRFLYFFDPHVPCLTANFKLHFVANFGTLEGVAERFPHPNYTLIWFVFLVTKSKHTCLLGAIEITNSDLIPDIDRQTAKRKRLLRVPRPTQNC